MYHPQNTYTACNFTPEVTHTLQGKRLFEHFVLQICGCPAVWTPANIVEDAIAKVRAQVGGDQSIVRFIRRCGFIGGGGVVTQSHRPAINLCICR